MVKSEALEILKNSAGALDFHVDSSLIELHKIRIRDGLECGYSDRLSVIV